MSRPARLLAAVAAACMLSLPALADETPACQSPAFVLSKLAAPPPPIAQAHHALNAEAVAALLRAGPQPVPDEIAKPAGPLTAEIYFMDDRTAVVVFFISGCASKSLHAGAFQILRWIQQGEAGA